MSEAANMPTRQEAALSHAEKPGEPFQRRGEKVEVEGVRTRSGLEWWVVKMNFVFRVAFYATALLMAYTMYSDLTTNEFPAGDRRAPQPLIYGGELRPYPPSQNPSANIELLFDNPELIYDMIMSSLRENSLNAPERLAPSPEIHFDAADIEPQDFDSITLPRSLIHETPSTDETTPFATPDGSTTASPAPSETSPDSLESATGLKLLGVISGRNGKLALINNQIWEEGDWLAGYRILHIKNGKVILQNKGGDVFFLGM